MKKVFASLFFILLFLSVSGQEMVKYDRVGLSPIYISYHDSLTSIVKNYYSNIAYDARYDMNNIPTKSIPMNMSRYIIEYKKDSEGKMVANYNLRDISENITSYLNDHNVGLEIISTIFNRKSDGRMDLLLLHHRGQYSSTDEDYLKSISTKRGADALKDTGENLIDKSYIVVFDNLNLRYEKGKPNAEGKRTDYYKGSIITYLYKIVWSEELLNQVWDCWIDENTPKGEIAAKKAAFEKIQIPIRLVYKYTNNSLSVTSDPKRPTEEKMGNLEVGNNKVGRYNTILNDGNNNSFNSLEGNVSDLSLKTTIFDIRPIRAKIGSKEGVNTDYAFYVYEDVLNADNTISQKRKGLVKATNNISDNDRITTGDFAPTEFYQYAGKSLVPGMSMIEKKIIGLSLTIGYAGFYHKTNGLDNSFCVGLEFDGYGGRHAQWMVAADFTMRKDVYNFGVNLGYGFRMNNFQLYPIVGIYGDMLKKDADLQENGLGWLGKLGLRANINIYYPVQLFVQGGYNMFLFGNDTYKNHNGGKSGQGIYFGTGLRFCF